MPDSKWRASHLANIVTSTAERLDVIEPYLLDADQFRGRYDFHEPFEHEVIGSVFQPCPLERSTVMLAFVEVMPMFSPPLLTLKALPM